ncbi:MAG: uroporphyrinogen decarboxylase family protein [Armatimonadota bacterium]
MTGKEILLKALRNEETPRTPWLPFVGSHGGSLIGETAHEYLTSADKLVSGLGKAIELYKPDGLPIIFDLQLEAEILGCDIVWSQDGPPSVVSHPLEKGDLADLPEFDLTKGRFPVIAEATRRMRAKVGEDVALYGLITGPFTLALHLMGTNIFMEMYDEPERVAEVLEFCTEVGKKVEEFYLANGCDVIAVVDPMTSQISPVHFQEYVAPYMNAIFDDVRSKGGYSSIFVCGNATRNLEVMSQTHCDNISVDENIDMSYLRGIAEKHNKSFGGNLKLTLVLLLGQPNDAKLDTIRCMDTCGQKGFILAPGCDIPYATPVANLQAVAEMVHDEYARNTARATLIAPEMSAFDDIKLPDYSNEKDTILDLITLDSSTCAPCQYMVAAAKKATKGMKGVVVREHKVTTHEGIGYMVKLGVANIPTICIDGEAKYISIIPTPGELRASIEMAKTAKG